MSGEVLNDVVLTNLQKELEKQYKFASWNLREAVRCMIAENEHSSEEDLRQEILRWGREMLSFRREILDVEEMLAVEWEAWEGEEEEEKEDE